MRNNFCIQCSMLLCKMEYKAGWNIDEFFNRINSEMMLPTAILSNVLNILEIDFPSIKKHTSNGVKLGRKKYYFKTKKDWATTNHDFLLNSSRNQKVHDEWPPLKFFFRGRLPSWTFWYLEPSGQKLRFIACSFFVKKNQ